MKLINAYPDGSLYTRPSRILAVISVTFQLAYVFSYSYTFCFKSPQYLQSLLNFTCTTPMTSITSLKHSKALFRIIPIIPLLYATFSTFIQCQAYIQTTNCQPGLPCSNYRFFTFSVILILIFSAELIMENFQTFLFVTSLTSRNYCYELAQRTLIGSRDFKNEISPSYLMNGVEHLQKLFEHQNQVTSPMFLIFLCQMIPWVGYRLLESLPNPRDYQNHTAAMDLSPELDTHFLNKIFSWCMLAYYGLIVYFAADTKRWAEQYRRNLTMLVVRRQLSVSGFGFPLQSFAWCKWIEETLKEVHIQGGPFLHFSFGLIGTVIPFFKYYFQELSIFLTQFNNYFYR